MEHAKLNYIQWDNKFLHEKPYQIISNAIASKAGVETKNFSVAEGPLEIIRDVRGTTSNFTLDSHGFQYVEHSFSNFDFHNDQEIEKVYLPEVEEFVNQVLGNTDDIVEIFDWRVSHL